MRYLKPIIGLFFVFATVLLHASSPEEMLNEALALSKQEKYAEAALLYEQILDAGVSSQGVNYNLGTAYLHESKIAKAILFLRKSLKLDPSDEDALQNLKIARSQVVTEVIAIPEFFIKRYWDRFALLFTSSVWAILGILCLILMLVSFYYWLMANDISTRKKAFYLCVLSLILFFISLFSGITKLGFENSTDQAVVMKETNLLIGADERSESLQGLSPGVELTIIDEIGDFYKVKLFDQEIGWVYIESVEPI